MSLLVPYNNAMRLGQGFNSYSQRICIDDAVVVSPKRHENFLTNSGQTMRTLAVQNSQPSLWTTEKEVLIDADRLHEAKTASQEITGEKIQALPSERQEQIRAFERRFAGEVSQGSNDSAPPPYREKNVPIPTRPDTRSWKINNIGGPSQTVTYSSRMVQDLSSVCKDMGISASLSIKAGTIAGSGRGSYIDSDKFLESDLNFVISVRVVNDTIVHRDPLEFSKLPDGVVSDDQFLEVYGDSYICAFNEGGEFQALVSMKVLNKSKLTEIAAAAAVAFSSGALGVSAQASFSLAKANIALNTETTITFTNVGGGNIKHPDEPWTIESLMRAAARFPENVARSPQRTHAVLHKYDHLRSYLAAKPPQLSKMNYDNVSLYTDELLDYFFVYKALISTITSDMRQIQEGTKRFRPMQKPSEDSFEATIDGLEEAFRNIRPQLSRIAERVDLIEKHPEIVSDPSNKGYEEGFVSPVQFWERLPVIESIKTGQATRPPLSGRRIGPDPEKKQSTSGEDAARKEELTKLCEEEPAGLSLTGTEVAKFLQYLPPAPTLKVKTGSTSPIRLTRPVGSRENGKAFFCFDSLMNVGGITHLSIGLAHGSLASISVLYRNGLQLRRGRADDDQDLFQLTDFADDETILTGTIECGTPEDGSVKKTLTAITLVTSRGRQLKAAAKDQFRYGYKCRYLDNRLFSELEEFTFEAPYSNAALMGFYGASEEVGDHPGLHRLGFAWRMCPEATELQSNVVATCTEPLHGLQHAPILLDSAMEGQLLPSERADLLTPAAKVRYRGLRFGPCIGTDQPPAGTMFNGIELLGSTPKVDFPSRITFVFSQANGPARLIAVQCWYGKVGLVHGADVNAEDATMKCLDVALAAGETVTSLQLPAASDLFAMPSGIAVVTNQGRSLSLDALSGTSSSSPFPVGRTVSGFQGMTGLKGFLGFETETSLTRLFPAWS